MAVSEYVPGPPPLRPEDVPRFLGADQPRIKAAIDDRLSIDAAVNDFMLKGALAEIEGQGIAQPLLRADARNIVAAQRTTVGRYAFTLGRTTWNGVGLAANGYPAAFVSAPSAAPQGLFVKYRADISTGATLVFETYTLIVAGQNLNEVRYDLLAGDRLWFSFLLNLSILDAASVAE